MDNISNRTLATLLIAAIVVSLGGTIVSLNKLNNVTPYQQANVPTGRAQSDIGNTSVTVVQALSIILQATPGTIVNFGSGHVNTSVAACSVLANMVARADDNADPSVTNIGGCWADSGGAAIAVPRGWVLENNGNLNASISVRGPTNISFFSLSGNPYPGGSVEAGGTILKWRLNVSDGGCADTPRSAWTEFSDNATACANLPFNEALFDDDVGFDVNITIPTDLPAGQYSNGTIEFYAVEAQ